MQKAEDRRLSWTSSLALAGALLCAGAARGQVVPDGTLGAAGALAGPAYAIPASLGQQFGGNLFHSFSQFNLSAGQSATFSGPATVQNIIGRVTGGSASSIDGLLRSSIANANLYLLNPKGILFGPNAQVDISGALHVATADYLNLGGGGRFAATNPASSVLSAAEPSAFGFLGANPAPITVNSSALLVPTGRSLSLVAGSLGISGVTLAAPAGQLNLVATSAAGEVALAGGAVTASGAGGAITIANSAINTNSSAGSPSGTIRIRGGQIVVVDSKIKSDNSEAGQGGDISIEAQRLSVSNGSVISTSTFGAGKGGNLAVYATESVSIYGRNASNERSYLLSSSGINSSGNAGSIAISAPLLTLDDAVVNSTSANPSSGNAGNVTVQVGRANLLNGGQINSSTFGKGHGGNISVIASESVSITGQSTAHDFLSGLISFTFGGAGGSISVTTPDLRLDGGIIATGAAGRQNASPAGDITLQVGRAALVNGGRVDATAFFEGNGGSINLTARDSLVISGSRDEALTETILRNFVRSNAPEINDFTYALLRPGFGDFASSGLFSRSILASGRGGSIKASAPQIVISDSGKISAASSSIGDAGSITLNASDRLTMLNGSSLTTEATVKDGGNIVVIAGNRVELRDSRITTSVGEKGDGKGKGGNITIDPTFVILNNSQVLANAFLGPGGNINIVSQFYMKSADSLVQASSRRGEPGIITVSAPNLDASAAQVAQAAYFDASLLMRESCSARASRAANSFTGAGRGGLPADPGQLAFGGYADGRERAFVVAGLPAACVR